MEKPLPVTSCTVCGKAEYNISLTNVQCRRTVNGKRCRGVNQSAIALYDWAKCPKCNGHGCNLSPWTGPGKACIRCDGAGWLFVRDDPYRRKGKILCYACNLLPAADPRSVLKLWNIWHDRIAAQALAPAMKGIRELIDAAEKNKIKPI